MTPLMAQGLPVVFVTRTDLPLSTLSWLTPADIPDTVEGLFQELIQAQQPRWLPPSALDIAELLPEAEVDPDQVRNLWPRPPDWHTKAVCAYSDPVETDPYFFGVDDVERPALPPAAVAAAREMCDRCTARVDCLLWALTNQERFGIWGGTTGRQRSVMRAALRRKQVTVEKLVEIYG